MQFFSLVQMLFTFVLNSDSQSYITIPQHKGKQNLNHWWVEPRYFVQYVLQLNIEPVSSLVYLFVTFSMLPKWKDIIYISFFRVSHYDCGRKIWSISIMYIKRRSCLVLNFLFHNAISTLIMRLVLKVLLIVKETSIKLLYI